MPKVVTDIMNGELPNLPDLNKTEVNKSNNTETSVSIYDLIKKQGPGKKEQVGVTLNKDIVDKLKTVSIDSNITLSKLFEDLLTPLLTDVVINPAHVELYNNKNKAKGRRVKTK